MRSVRCHCLGVLQDQGTKIVHAIEDDGADGDQRTIQHTAEQDDKQDQAQPVLILHDAEINGIRKPQTPPAGE